MCRKILPLYCSKSQFFKIADVPLISAGSSGFEISPILRVSRLLSRGVVAIKGIGIGPKTGSFVSRTGFG